MPGELAAAPSRGMTIATGGPAASAASAATRARPSPPRMASTICRWTARSRSTRAPPPRAAGSRCDPAAPIIARASGGRRRRAGVDLEDLLARLPGPDAVALLHREHEHLAVAHGAGARVLEDRVDDRLHVAVGHHALELDLGPQVVGQLRAAVALR